MAQGLITNTYLENIANAIRYKSGSVASYTPANMADAINAIPTGGGGTNLGTKDIIANGLYNANDFGYDGFSQVNVHVPSGSNIPVIEYNNTILHNNGKNTSEQFNLLKNYFNYPVEITDNVTNMFCWFDTFLNFNQPVVIPDSVINATQALARCPMFNAPVTIGNNVLDAHTLLYGCINFNQPIVFPKSVTNLQSALAATCFNYDIDIPYNTNLVDYLLEEDNAFGSNIYILNNTSLSAVEMLGYRDWGNRVNVYCNNMALVNKTSASTSIFGSAVEWTQMTNGYYNAQYNVYLYNNIFYETSSSLYAKYQGQGTFDGVIRMSDAVTNCAQMLNLCTNFNSSVQIGDNVTDCGALLRNAYNFNQPITIPNGVVNCRTMLQGTPYNHPLVIPDTVTNCKWMLYNCRNFNSPITIGNNVTDLASFITGYDYDDVTDEDVFEGGIFNYPVIIPNSAVNCSLMFGGQQQFNQPIVIPNSVRFIANMFRNCTNMKSDIVIGANAGSRMLFLAGTNYEGNIYAFNNTFGSREFDGKTNDTGRINYYVVGPSTGLKSVIDSNSAYVTNRAETWSYDSANDALGSDTANIYFYFNWDGALPAHLQ